LGECSIFGAKFQNHSAMRRHVNKHSNKVFVCEDCGNHYKNNDTLIAHQKKEHPEKFKRYTCNDCGKNFNSNEGLQEHVYHNNSTEKRYKCDMCSCAFKLNGQLTRHVIAVHRETAHFCNICNLSASDPYHLTQYKKKHQGLKYFFILFNVFAAFVIRKLLLLFIKFIFEKTLQLENLKIHGENLKILKMRSNKSEKLQSLL
jgi:KRAB domain-containing zinc finger protein